MPAMLDVDIQQTIQAWRQIATVPNLSAGKGKDGRKSGDSLKKLQDYHKVLSVALSSFLSCYENGGFFWEDEDGQEILLKPYIHMIIGDIAGVNEMVGHYNTCAANCVVKDCKCNHDDILSFPPKCQQVKWFEIQSCNTPEEIFALFAQKGLVSEKDMSEAMTDPNFAKSISKHSISNAFDSLPLSDPYQGIIGMTPQEMLHLMGSGLFKYLIFGIKDVIGENNKNSKVKGLINDVFPDIKMHINRNAERDVSRMSNRNGFFNVTSLTNEEIRGNFFGLTVLMQTSYGDNLLRPHFEGANIDFDEMVETCKLVLAWERFYLDPQKRKDIINAEVVTWDLQQRIFRNIPRVEKEKTKNSPGSKGWKIAKMHAKSFFSGLVLKFGSAKTFDSGANEKHHKFFVKGNAKLTQRISSKFSAQLSRNDYDRVVIDRVFQHIKHHCSKDHTAVSSGVITDDYRQYYQDSDSDEDEDPFNDNELAEEQTNEGIALMGAYDMTVDINAQGRIEVTHDWKYQPRNDMGITPNIFVGKTVADASIKYTTNHRMPNNTTIHIQGFTSALIGGHLYRTNPDWKGYEWYDWATVQFPKTVDSVGGDTSICRIMGFVRYKDVHALTYEKMEIQGLDPQAAAQQCDKTVYALVHCQTQYFSYSRLQSQFFRKFVMEEADSMRLIPARCLKGPLLVIPDIEDANTASSLNYIVSLPRHKMGVYWLHHVNAFMTENEDEDDIEGIMGTVAQTQQDEIWFGNNW